MIERIAARAGIEVRAFADNNAASWTTSTDAGPVVLSPQSAVDTYNGSVAFVLGVFNSEAPRAQLAALGARNVAAYPAFSLEFAKFASRFIGFERPESILGQRDDIARAFAALSDDESREEFAAQIAWRCTLDYSLLPSPRDPVDTYFDPGVFRLRNDETLVDCGAFDGDTLRAFSALSGGQFGHIDACEPDPLNREKLQRYIESLPAEAREKIAVLPYALGSKDETVFFNSGHGVGSAIDEGAQLAVQSRRLDGVVTRRPTLIKMDIEGAEPDALIGAELLLKSARPVLAISAYHYPEHLWSLPLIIKSIVPEYSLFLRRYAQECWELVYYAVPRERLGVH